MNKNCASDPGISKQIPFAIAFLLPVFHKRCLVLLCSIYNTYTYNLWLWAIIGSQLQHNFLERNKLISNIYYNMIATTTYTTYEYTSTVLMFYVIITLVAPVYVYITYKLVNSAQHTISCKGSFFYGRKTN